MGYPTKIATCCYCGTRAALVLTGKTRHELSCAACGAPLHNLKMLPKEKGAKRHLPSGGRARATSTPPGVRLEARRKPVKPKKGKRRKGFVTRLLDEAFDVIEDIFD